MIKLYNGDCLEVMKQIPDESIDLIVSDPPYLINYKTNWRKDKSHDFCKPIQNDDNKNVIELFIKEAYRVLKNNSAMYCFCSPKTVHIFLEFLFIYGFTVKNQIVWKKNNHTLGDLKAQFGQCYEIILLVNKGRKVFNGKRITDVWEFKRVSGKKQLHQNQKPVELLEQCIRYHSNEGDVILDCFMGSGSTGVACKNTNRSFIGIELDRNYFDIANNRIAELFDVAI